MKKNTNNRGCGYGKFNNLQYRICYGLTDDRKMDYSTPHYEFIKHCTCESCNRRFKYHEGIGNSLTVTTDDKAKFPEIENMINNYTCNENQYIGRKFISLLNGKVEEKTL